MNNIINFKYSIKIFYYNNFKYSNYYNLELIFIIRI